MRWFSIIEASVAASIVAIISDWLFFGVLFHSKYQVYPEVWRKPAAGERRHILHSAVLTVVTSTAFVIFCVWLEASQLGQTVGVAVAIWLIVALPMTLSNAIFMKIHGAVVFAHCLGWLVKLLIAAVAVSLLLK